MTMTRFSNGNELFGSLLDDMFSPARTSMSRSLLRMPEADVIETEDQIRVVMDTPGIRPSDIDVSLENNILTVSGERHAQGQEGDERHTWHVAERRYGRFSRSFMLPRDVDAERIDAEFQDGVLQISIPKAEKARRRRIEIRTGSESGDTRRIEGSAT